MAFEGIAKIKGIVERQKKTKKPFQRTVSYLSIKNLN